MSNRRIHIEGEEYLYRIGKGNVVFQFPSGKKFFAGFNDVLDMPRDIVDREMGRKQLQITPSDLKSYLIEKVLQ